MLDLIFRPSCPLRNLGLVHHEYHELALLDSSTLGDALLYLWRDLALLSDSFFDVFCIFLFGRQLKGLLREFCLAQKRIPEKALGPGLDMKKQQNPWSLGERSHTGHSQAQVMLTQFLGLPKVMSNASSYNKRDASILNTYIVMILQIYR